MTTDPYKSITIQYNFLNLPRLVTKGGASIGIRYSPPRLGGDASGRKWSQTGTEGIREYVGGIEYVDQKIQSVQHGEGRLVATYNAGGTAIESIRAEYWRQDHLGNVRVSFSDFNQDGVIVTKDDQNTTENDVEITQENHYYPFGLNHEGPWYQTIQPKNKYTYNGKEYVKDLGLNWNDYGARWYDAAVGRWNAVDQLAEDYLGISPYTYVANNPLKYIDPDGRYIDIGYQDEKGETKYYRYGSGGEAPNAFVQTVVNTLDKLVSDGLDVEGVITTLGSDDSASFIYETTWDDHNNSMPSGDGGNVNWSPEGGIVTDNGENRSPAVGLLHELGHLYYEKYNPEGLPPLPDPNNFDSFEDFNKAFDQYENTLNEAAGRYDNPSDKWIIERVENPASQKLGQPTRSSHSSRRKYRAESPFSIKEKSK